MSVCCKLTLAVSICTQLSPGVKPKSTSSALVIPSAGRSRRSRTTSNCGSSDQSHHLSTPTCSRSSASASRRWRTCRAPPSTAPGWRSPAANAPSCSATPPSSPTSTRARLGRRSPRRCANCKNLEGVVERGRPPQGRARADRTDRRRPQTPLAHVLVGDGLSLGPKLAIRLISEINETTLIYQPAGGRQGRPHIRTILAEVDGTNNDCTTRSASTNLPQHPFRSRTPHARKTVTTTGKPRHHPPHPSPETPARPLLDVRPRCEPWNRPRRREWSGHPRASIARPG